MVEIEEGRDEVLERAAGTELEVVCCTCTSVITVPMAERQRVRRQRTLLIHW